MRPRNLRYAEHFDMEAELRAAQQACIAAHLATTVPLLEHLFGAIPLIVATYPGGIGAHPVYLTQLDDTASGVLTRTVQTSSGVHRFATLASANLAWLTRTAQAVELLAWSPLASDPERAAFARIVVEPQGTVEYPQLVAALHCVREALSACGLDAIVLDDGVRGFALWIPFADAPAYDALATWLHAFVGALAAGRADLLTIAPLRRDRGDRVYLGIRSNHPGMGSVLPYQLRGLPGLPLALPLEWSKLESHEIGSTSVERFAAWYRENGDLFARLHASMATQTLPSRKLPESLTQRREHVQLMMMQSVGLPAAPVLAPPSPVLTTVLGLMADGKWYSADDLYAKATAAGLLPHTSRKHLYSDLSQYILRSLGGGNTPDIVQDPVTKAFRLNMPLDIWPDVALTPLPAFLSETRIAELSRMLRTSANGDDPQAFEVAVCAAFAALGFMTRHIGGTGYPDGTLDAPLGVDAYRVILECKTASLGNVVANPRPEEPDSFREAFHGTYAVIVGPAFSNDATLDSELQKHGVSLWTVEDLCTMLESQIGPHTLRAAFAPGRAKTRCETLVWERAHGRRKRIAVLARSIMQVGWRLQTAFAASETPNRMPPLTLEALELVVDESLVAQGLPSAAAAEFHAAVALLQAEGLVMPAIATPDTYVITQAIDER